MSGVCLILNTSNEARLDKLYINELVIIKICILQSVFIQIHLEEDKGQPFLILIFDCIIVKYESSVGVAIEREMLISKRCLSICPLNIDESIISHCYVYRILCVE